MRTIFIGDKPSPRMKKNARPFEGALCHGRLLSWINVLGAYPYTLYNRVNLKMCSLIEQDVKTTGCKVIALGNVASEYLTEIGINHFKLPHPSGRNRQLNNKKFIGKQLKLAKEYLEGE